MKYNSRAIRDLLCAAFDNDELYIFVQDHFQKVAENFPTMQTKTMRAQALIEYCERRGCIDELIQAIKDANPAKYTEYHAQLTAKSEEKSETMESHLAHFPKRFRVIWPVLLGAGAIIIIVVTAIIIIPGVRLFLGLDSSVVNCSHIDLRSNAPGVYEDYGDEYRRRKEYECAIKDYMKALEGYELSNQKRGEILTKISSMYLYQGYHDRAISFASDAINLEFKAYAARGIAYATKKRMNWLSKI